MHELSITEGILEIALRHAAEAGAGKVTNLYLVIGELSTIVDESVQFYWDFVSEGTDAQGSTLHFKRVPALLSCRSCGRQFSVREDLTCPDCASQAINVLSGDEFYLEAIDVAHSEQGVFQ